MTLIAVGKGHSLSYSSKLLISKRWASIDYLLTAIAKRQDVQSNETFQSSNIPSMVDPSKLPPKDLTKLVITPNQLNDYFRHKEYPKPTKKQISETQSFFCRSKFRLEWTFDKYEDIPDIKYNKLQQEKLDKLDRIEPYKRNEYYHTYLNSKKTFGINPEFLKPLPEVLLLGHTNVGKSSLINNLFLNKEESKTSGAGTEYAFVSRRAGFTKTLNCFNIGNKLRIIDSPGYGEFGEEKQGEVVVDYISKRKVLRSVFVLVDGVQGFREEDLHIINHLINEGVAFEIVFTKVDQVISKFMPKKSTVNLDMVKRDLNKRIEIANLIGKSNNNIIDYFAQIIESANLNNLVTLPTLLFNNSQSNKFINMRYGYKEIRFSILQGCGLVSEDSSSIQLNEELNKEQNKVRRRTRIKKLS